MTDVSITAANVKPGANAIVAHGTAGATITAGQVVYLDTTSGKYKLADNDLAAAKTPTGIALNGASDGQPIAVQVSGDLTAGGTLTAGTAYYLSATAGGICPVADLTTGDNVAQLGLAKSATVLALRIQVPGVTL